MPGLLMFYVGGTAPGANIELHDVQFAAADRPEEAYPLLREKWFGDKRKVHVDGYARIDWADGYDVSLEPAPFAGEEKLFSSTWAATAAMSWRNCTSSACLWRVPPTRRRTKPNGCC